jgi:predicted secreted protein
MYPLQETFMKKLLLPLMVAVLILTACNAKPTQATVSSTQPASLLPGHTPPTAAELEVTDPAKPIEVTAGSEFTITVLVNLSADYHWEVAKALDVKIVDYVWKDHVDADPNVPNSFAHDVWRFKAIAPGTTTITLGYYQGLTENAPQMPVYTIVVK